MSAVARTRSAVSPLRRRSATYPVRRPTVDEVVAANRPEDPIHCLRPAAVAATARAFAKDFSGEMLYAVKCNPDPAVLRALWDGGVRHFDCASLPEVRVVRDMFPEAAIHFMHPVKARGAIREAWGQHDVRDFVLDSAEELVKIRTEIAATGVPGALRPDRAPCAAEGRGEAGSVRQIRCPGGRSGGTAAGSACLRCDGWSQLPCRVAVPRSAGLARCAGADRAGCRCVRRHGGCHRCWRRISRCVSRSGSTADRSFFAEIEAGFERLGLVGARLWAEPGRALVAAGTSIVVQVQARRGDALYVNDGVYGSLSDAGTLAFRYPVRLIRPDGDAVAETIGFSPVWADL